MCLCVDVCVCGCVRLGEGGQTHKAFCRLLLSLWLLWLLWLLLLLLVVVVVVVVVVVFLSILLSVTIIIIIVLMFVFLLGGGGGREGVWGAVCFLFSLIMSVHVHTFFLSFFHSLFFPFFNSFNFLIFYCSLLNFLLFLKIDFLCSFQSFDLFSSLSTSS